MKLKDRIIDALINRAKRTPYMHLDGYMERFWLFRLFKQNGGQARFAGKIHHILRSDEGRDFHDHPWPYLTIILRGGYTEHRPVFDKSGLYRGETSRWYGPGSIIFRPARSWHRLELPNRPQFDTATGTTKMLPQTAWTLFITGPKVNSWGFLVEPKHKVYYRDYARVFPCYQQDAASKPPVFSGYNDSVSTDQTGNT